MGLLTLYIGLLLPWLGGTLWLIFADNQFNSSNQVNRLRQAGYGFFLGYAVLFLAIIASDKFFGLVSWPELMGFLLIFAASGGFAAWRSRHSSAVQPIQAVHPINPFGRILTTIMMVLMLVHLIFICVEIFTQPVYPWDAWLAWVYRAKAWFMAGNIAPVVNAADWTTASSANTYTIAAWRYPLFPSVIPYWAALSLGDWSETLVNLPVLFAGSALGMAIYGQCREQGLNVTASLIILYLLYSIPLLGTHLALAGYADIWMAGFAGLGFVALMRSSITRDESGKPGFQMLLGFFMVLFSISVKNEGAVWLLAAIAMLILANCRPRVPILIMVAAVVVASIVFALGFTYIDIPMIGKLGMVDGRLAIPFIGSFVLELHDVRYVYWDSFINMGSWNLLWVFVAASLLMGFKSPNVLSGYRARRTALSFILIFIATQLFIFGFTNQGLWADTYTALNRLPLHFVPALLFAVVLMAQASLMQGETITETQSGEGDRKTAKLLVAALLALVMVVTGAIAFLSKGLPEHVGDPIKYPATKLNFAFGSGHPVEDRMLVDEFADGYALLSSGPVSIQAKEQRVLTYTWLPPELLQEAAFFWRRSDDSQNVMRTEITIAGTQQIDLSKEPDWKGEIIEFGFLIAGVNGKAVEIGEAALIPDSLNTRIQLSWRAWTTFEEWTQKSINFLYGGDFRQVIALPMLVSAWLLATLLLFWLFTRVGKPISSRQLLITAGLLSLIAWVLLDIRWSANNIRQIQLSFQTQWNADEQQRSSIDLDGDVYRYMHKLKSEVLGDEAARILILGDQSHHDYYLLRAKYHLLPHSVDVVNRIARTLTPDSIDFVIFFGEPGGINQVPGWNPSWQKSLVAIDRGEWGVAYRVE